MADEGTWIDRAQTAEAKVTTITAQVERLKSEVRAIHEAFGSRKKSDGSYEIDYEAFVARLGVDGALEIRRIIDETYSMSGAPGEKPRMRVKAA